MIIQIIIRSVKRLLCCASIAITPVTLLAQVTYQVPTTNWATPNNDDIIIRVVKRGTVVPQFTNVDFPGLNQAAVGQARMTLEMTNADFDYVVAFPVAIFDANPNTFWTANHLQTEGAAVPGMLSSICAGSNSIATYNYVGGNVRVQINEQDLAGNWSCRPYRSLILVGRVRLEYCNLANWMLTPCGIGCFTYTCANTTNYTKNIYIELINPYATIPINFGNNCIGTNPILNLASPAFDGIGQWLNLESQSGAHISEQANSTGHYTLSTTGHGTGQVNVRTNWNFPAGSFANGPHSLIGAYNASGNVLALPSLTLGSTQVNCDNSGNINITGAVPAGGTWSNASGFVSGNTFNTNAAPPGDHTITYHYTDGNGCSNSAGKTFQVQALPNVSGGSDVAVCDNSGLISLGGSPAGGVWNGSPNINGADFNTNSATPGNYALTYSFTNANGCTNVDEKNVNVLPLPVVNAGVDISHCFNGGNLPLSGQSPAGGSWGGPGVSGNTFNPIGAGVGSHNISYSFTDASGCSNVDVRIITVTPAPTVSAGSDQEVCVSENAFTLLGASPGGGSWSGAGVSGSSFSPSTAGVGTHYLTYQFTNGSGCMASDVKIVVVNALPVVSAGPDLPHCINVQQFPITGGSPGGGTWSGNGVNVNLFNPALAGVGDHTLTYSYTNNNGCTNTDTRVFTVEANTPVAIGEDRIFCASSAVYVLSNDIAPAYSGGVWSGSGVTGNNFNPTNVAAGAYTITYTYTNADGCVSAQNKEFSVVPGPTVDAGPVEEVCVNDAPLNLLGASPVGGTWSGIGIVNGNQFDPSVAGEGVTNITYTYNAGVCIINDIRQIVVNTPTPVDAGPNLNVCNNSPDFPLTGASSQGGIWSSPFAAGGFFSPVNAGIGQHVVQYTFTNNDGCVSNDTRIVNVNAAPALNAGSDLQLCSNGQIYPLIQDANLAGGFFSGPGVQSLNFNPGIVALGSHQITYTYVDLITGCSASDFRYISVIAPQVISVGANLQTCIDSAPISLSGFESIGGGVWSGAGVSGSGIPGFEFAAEMAGAGQHQLTYAVMDNNGCNATAMKTVSVSALPIVEAGQDIFVCSGAPLVPLNGSAQPVGGSFSGPFILGNNFDVGASGAGSFVVTYTVTNANGCTNSDTKNVYVDAGATVNAGENFSVCSGAPLVDLASRVTPGGGTFVGVGVNGTNFNPNAPPGTYTITYTLENTYGCAGSDDFQITVNPLPAVNAGSTRSLCLNVAPYNLALTSVPSGGTFSGPGVSGNFFEPSTAGLGAHTVYYTYTNAQGCSNTGSRVITVTDLPTVNAGANLFMCSNAPLTDLTVGATPVNGTWTGTGVTNGIFNAAQAGVGQHVLSYNITQGNGCSNTDFKVITVFPPLAVDAGPNINVCSNASAFNLSNGASVVAGSWSGQGVSNGTFNPSVGAGSYMVTLNYSDFYGCSASDTKIVNVVTPQAVSVGSDQVVCTTASSINLAATVFPPGGSFAGPGVTGQTFNPLLAGVGNQAVTYTVTDGQGCVVNRVRNLTVSPPPAVDGGLNRIVCLGSNPVDLDLGTSIPGGSWSGLGVSGAYFNPANAGLGNHVVTYQYNHGNGCLSTDTKTISVRENPIVNAGFDRTYCVNDLPLALTGEADLPNGTWTGAGVGNSQFSPTSAGPGLHILTYRYTDAFGCVAQDTKNVLVRDKPFAAAAAATELCTTAPALNLSQSAYPPGGVWAGPGVNGNFFQPQNTGPGAFSLSYTVTDNNGCSNTVMRPVTVTLPPSVDTGPNVTLCLNAPLLDLDLSTDEAGGVWTGTGVSYNQFDAAYAGVGNHVMSYVYNDGAGCISQDTKVIVVRNPPSVNAGGDVTLCLNASQVSLATQATPVGGQWSGVGVSQNSIFNPLNAGVGYHTLTYRFTDNYNCSVTDHINIVVNSLPVVDAGPAANICTTASPLNLNFSAYPAGGNWSGAGVISGHVFNPAQVGVGTFDVNYSYTDAHGCSSNDTRRLTVQLPQAVSAGPSLIVCSNSAQIDLASSVSSVGGVWSGAGVNGTYFSPAVAGEGIHHLTYTLDNGSGCVSVANKIIQVRGALTVDAGADVNVCSNGATISLSNFSASQTFAEESWTGAGVANGNFVPSNVGPGIYNLTYHVEDEFGCRASDQRTITVYAPTVVSAGPDRTFCADAASASLNSNVFPSGGTWIGQGVDVAGNFVPGNVGPGNYTATYQYVNAAGCLSTDQMQVTVVADPVVNAGPDFQVCVNAAPLELTQGSPSNGVWSGPGVLAGTFDPLAAGIGVHELTYTGIDNYGCSNDDKIEVTVLAQPSLSIGGDVLMCMNELPLDLSSDATMKGGSFEGHGVTGNIFNPSQAGEGVHVISYSIRFNGCELFAFRNIIVHAPDVLTVGGNLTVCVATPSFSLLGDVNIVGGVFSGAGMTADRFDPAVAGLGAHVITYTYTNSFGCTSSAFRVITVQEQLPVFAGADITLCNSVGYYELVGRGTPEGGVYVGRGLVNNVFDPTSAGFGTHSIRYVVNNGNGCVSEDEMLIHVKPSTITNFGKDSIVCINADPIPLNFSHELAGGTWSGEGVVANTFWPTLAEEGVFTLSYQVSTLDCDVAGRRIITVTGLPQAAVADDKQVSGCIDAFVTLEAAVSPADRIKNVTVEWRDEGGNVVATGESTLFQVRGEEKIYYSSVNQFGCSSGQKDFVRVKTDNPTGDFYTDDDVIPFGKPIQFISFGVTNTESYEWHFGDGLNSYERHPWKYYYEDGEFNVSLTLTSKTGCETTITKEKYVEVLRETGRVPRGGRDGRRGPGGREWVARGPGGRERVASGPGGRLLGDDVLGENQMLVGGVYVDYGPNPNEGRFVIRFLAGSSKRVRVDVVDFLGRTVFSKGSDLPEGVSEMEIDLSGEINGVYTVRVESEGEMGDFKIVKQ